MSKISRRGFLAAGAALLSGAAPAEAIPSPQGAVAAAALDASLFVQRDLKKLADDPKAEVDAPYQRYLWLPCSGKEREDFLTVLALHLNLLSDQGDLSFPVVVQPDLLRIDIRDYGWDKRPDVWEKTAKVDVHFHSKLNVLRDVQILQVWPGGVDSNATEKVYYKSGIYPTTFRKGFVVDIPALWLPGKEINYLRETLLSESPILNAEWFFVQTARQISIRNKDEGCGYYDFLGLKGKGKQTDLQAFYKLIGLNEKVAIEKFQEWRAVVEKSGVSQQNRQIVVLKATTGRVWITLDTFKEAGRGIAKRNLKRGEFAFDALEIYGFLPNGLFVTFLSDNKGKRQDSAPDKIGGDTSSLNISRDTRIHANLSCFRCHGVDKDFLKPIDDWVRRTFVEGGSFLLQDPDKKTLLELRSQYMRDLGRLLTLDRDDYLHVIGKATRSKIKPAGLKAVEITRLYGNEWNRIVERRVSVTIAAAEMGVTPAKFVGQLRKYHAAKGGIDLVLGAFLDGKSISRLEWESSLALAQTVTLGLLPPEIPKEVKAR